MAVLKPKLVEQKLRELHGNMAAVARHFGVTRAAVYNCVRRRPQLQEVIEEAREAMKDHAVSALHTAIFKGEAWAICFYLKTQAKDRGYIERTELRHGGDANAPPIRHTQEPLIDWSKVPQAQREALLDLHDTIVAALAAGPEQPGTGAEPAPVSA